MGWTMKNEDSDDWLGRAQKLYSGEVDETKQKETCKEDLKVWCQEGISLLWSSCYFDLWQLSVT